MSNCSHASALTLVLMGVVNRAMLFSSPILLCFFFTSFQIGRSDWTKIAKNLNEKGCVKIKKLGQAER